MGWYCEWELTEAPPAVIGQWEWRGETSHYGVMFGLKEGKGIKNDFPQMFSLEMREAEYGWGVWIWMHRGLGEAEV